jgi:hypothetical protein
MVGTHISRALDFPLQGRLNSELTPFPNHPKLLRCGLVAYGDQISHWHGSSRPSVEDRYGCVESLYLPISDRRRETKAAFGMVLYQWLPKFFFGAPPPLRRPFRRRVIGGCRPIARPQQAEAGTDQPSPAVVA